MHVQSMTSLQKVHSTVTMRGGRRDVQPACGLSWVSQAHMRWFRSWQQIWTIGTGAPQDFPPWILKSCVLITRNKLHTPKWSSLSSVNKHENHRGLCLAHSQHHPTPHLFPWHRRRPGPGVPHSWGLVTQPTAGSTAPRGRECTSALTSSAGVQIWPK